MKVIFSKKSSLVIMFFILKITWLLLAAWVGEETMEGFVFGFPLWIVTNIALVIIGKNWLRIKVNTLRC